MSVLFVFSHLRHGLVLHLPSCYCCVQDFREKNSDLIHADLVSVLKNSNTAFVKELVGKWVVVWLAGPPVVSEGIVWAYLGYSWTPGGDRNGKDTNASVGGAAYGSKYNILAWAWLGLQD